MTYQARAFAPEIQHTLSDVLTWAERTGEKYDAICEIRKIPARMGMIDDDIGLIPADPAHFDRLIATTAYGCVSKASDLDAARRRGNARARALLKRFHAAHCGHETSVTPAIREVWTRLIAWIEANEGFTDRGACFPTGKARSLYILRSRCRVAPFDFGQQEFDRIHADATSQARKSLRKAVALMNTLIETRDALPVADLLPGTALTMPQSSDRAHRLRWPDIPYPLRTSTEAAIRKTLARPEDQAALAEARILDGEDPKLALAELEAGLETGRRFPENEAGAANGYRQAVTWLYRAARDGGSADTDRATLTDLISYPNLRAACVDQIARSGTSDMLKDPETSQTLRSRLANLRTLARHGLKRDDLVGLIDLAAKANKRHVLAPGEKRNAEIDMVCRRLRDTPRLAGTFVRSPFILAEKAIRMILEARASENKTREDRGLRLYAAAVMYAIQNSRPLRPANLIRLRHRGSPEAPGNIVWVRNGRHAELRFPVGEIKNARLITVAMKGEDAEILRTWLKEYRPRLLELRNLADTPYVFPGEARPRHLKRGVSLPTGCVSPSTFSEIWNLGERQLGLGLTPHQCRHAVATLILASDPGNFARVASVLGDSEDTVRKHYGIDSGEAASASVRGALLAQHPDIFRKLKGRLK